MSVQFTAKIFFVLAAISSLVFLNSCVKEGCTDDLATNYDSKVKKDDGSCIYPRDKFIGTYAVSDTCSSTTAMYSISVSESSTGKNYISISNFGDYGVSVTATVGGSEITFNQTSGGVIFTGNGSIAGEILTINYTAVVGGATDSCVKVCMKQ